MGELIPSSPEFVEPAHTPEEGEQTQPLHERVAETQRLVNDQETDREDENPDPLVDRDALDEG